MKSLFWFLSSALYCKKPAILAKPLQVQMEASFLSNYTYYDATEKH